MSARKQKKSSDRAKPHRSSAKSAAIAPPQEQKKFLELYNARSFIEAEHYAEKLTQRYPKDAFGWKVLGSCLHKNGQIMKAKDALSQSLQINTNDAQAQHLMARTWYDLGDPTQAMAYANKALTLEPSFSQGHHTLAEVLTESGNYQNAFDHACKAEELGYERTSCLLTKGHLFIKLGRYNEAKQTYEMLISEIPENIHFLNDIANLYKDLGQFSFAEKYYHRACEIDPDYQAAFSNYLICKHYNPECSGNEIYHAIRQWESRFSLNRTPFQHIPANNSSDKIIRIGLVSSGLRLHPVGQMICAALEQHLGGMEFHAYSTNNTNDHITERLKKCTKSWHLVRHLNQEELAEKIQKDEIDILFDLSGYGDGSRLKTMSYKPAPIIVKWVGGLINTMGLPAFDYLLSDRFETPESSDNFYTEKLIRLPNDYICYTPPNYAPSIKALPALYNSFITLGCFNNPAKINRVLLGEWAKIMQDLPESRLLLKSIQYSSSEYCDFIRDVMYEYGISADRLILEGPSKHRELLDSYNRVDIALDTWPYSGGLTTCEAFMMGVPVVTLPGPTFAGRHSATHLINAGMPELVTSSWEEYRQRVVELASDIPNLSVIRACLRQFLIQSPVCDAEKFGKHFSTAMRAIWQRYCEGNKATALKITEEGGVFEEKGEKFYGLQKNYDSTERSKKSNISLEIDHILKNIK
ncbi:putative O-linked N-acetylglucosamine transferase (SPINDLY family) [Kushneria sinocarnis]|uniref:protein O-GlcNAc transferase n=1 Tax=Kushneria sinocarnis TaxID=595502 RepID=A0A420WY79_9GAMM|nr:tetratricopeptide repeat protein [Kushneria sinocarnis]RKR06111.1 putative O-linked N-acetylglucosamine transferase (SPINDLY family) [Kushneria sinocarnis]